MRVLFLSHMFPSSVDPLAGVFVLEQMRALREVGVEIVAVAPTPWVPSILRFMRRGQKYWKIPMRDNVHGFPVEYPRALCFPGGRLFYLYGLFYYFGCLRLVKRLVHNHKIEIIHAHTILPDGFAGVLLGRTLQLPVVCTVHGSDINIYPHRNRCTLWATRWALKRMGRVIAVSGRLKEKVLALATVERVEVLYNGADPTRFCPMSKDEAREKLGLPMGTQSVLFAGDFVEVKGLEYLLVAFARMNRPETSLWVVGDGYLKAKYVAVAKNLGLAKRVSFVGYRPHSEMPLWLAAADCLAIPSISEGFPTLLPEAMLCRIPVVATCVGGIPEIIDAPRNGLLVEPHDPMALAEAISAVLDGVVNVTSMIEAAERTAREGFTWMKNASRLRACYEDLLSFQEPTPGSC